MILKDRMRLHKLYMKLSHMVSIFIEIFDAKVLYAINPMVYISRQYGNTQKLLINNKLTFFQFFRTFFFISLKTTLKIF